eukprot:1727865-Rhodomonas_salina.1
MEIVVAFAVSVYRPMRLQYCNGTYRIHCRTFDTELAHNMFCSYNAAHRKYYYHMLHQYRARHSKLVARERGVRVRRRKGGYCHRRLSLVAAQHR